MSEHLREAWRRTATPTPPPVLYHYTSTYHFTLIRQMGHLRLTDSNIDLFGGGPGVVWLTTTSAAAGNGLEGSALDKSEIRFEVPTAGLPIHHWPVWSREQGIDEGWYNALASAGGNPETWWVCTAPIEMHRTKVTVRTPEGYLPVAEEDLRP